MVVVVVLWVTNNNNSSGGGGDTHLVLVKDGINSDIDRPSKSCFASCIFDEEEEEEEVALLLISDGISNAIVVVVVVVVVQYQLKVHFFVVAVALSLSHLISAVGAFRQHCWEWES